MKAQIKFYRNWIIAVIAGIGVLLLLVLANYQYTQRNPGGNHFLISWLGTRSYLTNGMNPYSEEAAQVFQEAVEEHSVAGESNAYRFVSPLYSIVIYLPFAFIRNYILARAIWMTLLEISLFVQVMLGFKLIGKRVNWLIAAIVLLPMIFWVPSWLALKNGDVIILVSLCIIGGLTAIRLGYDEFAGALFAFATLKPNVVMIFLLFIIFWSIRQHRWRLLTWMFVTVILLSVSVALLMPDWLLHNIRSIVQLVNEDSLQLLPSILSNVLPGLGMRIGWILFGFSTLLMLLEWFLFKRTDYRAFLWMACFTLLVSQWVGVRLDIANLLLVFPAIVLLLSLWNERWQRMGKYISAGFALILLVVMWLMFAGQSAEYAKMTGYFITILPFILIFGLYWFRWWIIRAPNLWFEEIYAQEHPEGI